MSALSLRAHEAAVHAWFGRHAEELDSRLAAAFGRLDADAREEAVADGRASVFARCLSAARRGTLFRITPFTAAYYAWIGYRAGRRFTGTSRTDVLAEATRAAGRVRILSYDGVPAPGEPADPDSVSLAEALADPRGWDVPPENVRRNGDYPAILEDESVNGKARRLFAMLAESQGAARNKDIAAALRVSEGRATQLKTILAEALERHGYGRPNRRGAFQGRRRVGQNGVRRVGGETASAPAA